MWLRLRPLIVVTGALRVEGGQGTPDRQRAVSISTGYMRRLRRLRVLKTPFGHILDQKHLKEVQQILREAAGEVQEFHSVKRTCSMSNCMIWEPLKGNRLTAFEAWLAAHRHDQGVKEALPALRADDDAA